MGLCSLIWQAHQLNSIDCIALNHKPTPVSLLDLSLRNRDFIDLRKIETENNNYENKTNRIKKGREKYFCIIIIICMPLLTRFEPRRCTPWASDVSVLPTWLSVSMKFGAVDDARRPESSRSSLSPGVWTWPCQVQLYCSSGLVDNSPIPKKVQASVVIPSSSRSYYEM